jgi:phenylpropionate dioxygenase-like ring-hydroxylating dioxygenase large terminal subunit
MNAMELNMLAKEGARPLAYNGYHRRQTAEPDLSLLEVGRGTPGGEYQRRFWHPICYVSELGDVPLRARALGEDLVVFRDLKGRIGVLHLRCCHRNTSLEFGVLTEKGIRCCYHGREYDVDGTIVDMPGEPAADRLRQEASQGAYPTHVFGGIVFVYMGPPERVPVFPMLDRFKVSSIQHVPGERLVLDCNWLQVKENAVDPHHTNILHVIPQMRGMNHFADEFGNFPELTWIDTPAGVIYLAAREVGDKVWVRSAEIYGANIHCISSIFEDGRQVKPASYPFMTFWTLPVDDDHSVNFFISHVGPDEKMPFEKRRKLEVFGQHEDRPYKERQWIPGDHEAQVGQGAINNHAMEQLGTQDRGIIMFRRCVRRGIQAVQKGQDPKGFFLTEDAIAPSFANDVVVPAAEIGGDPKDSAALRDFAERVGASYLAHPPMQHLA